VSEPEAFLTRWARRKRDAAKDAPAVAANSDASDEPSPEAAIGGAKSADPAHRGLPEAEALPSLPPVSDAAQLPALDSISAATDVRAFLAPGVPAELTRAALRRAWSADPAIRDFVGLADYDWDFNTPGAIAGFQPFEMTEELHQRITDMVGRNLPSAQTEQPAAENPAEVNGDDEIAARIGESSAEFNFVSTQAAPASRPQGQGDSEEFPRSSRKCEELDASNSKYIASQHASLSTREDSEVLPTRHGGALPK
jgi:hypothetical protein